MSLDLLSLLGIGASVAALLALLGHVLQLRRERRLMFTADDVAIWAQARVDQALEEQRQEFLAMWRFQMKRLGVQTRCLGKAAFHAQQQSPRAEAGDAPSCVTSMRSTRPNCVAWSTARVASCARNVPQ